MSVIVYSCFLKTPRIPRLRHTFAWPVDCLAQWNPLFKNQAQNQSNFAFKIFQLGFILKVFLVPGAPFLGVILVGPGYLGGVLDGLGPLCNIELDFADFGALFWYVLELSWASRWGK